MNASCSSCRRLPGSSPAAVTTSAPSRAALSCRQLKVRRPSTRTVQAPHCPWSQPFLTVVTDSCSRNVSSRVLRVSTVRVRSDESTVNEMVAWGTAVRYPRHGWRKRSRRRPVGTDALGHEVRGELAGQVCVHPTAYQRPLGGVLERLHLAADVDTVEQVAALVGQ